ncbi:unnamed protein product [Amoebophrya sp. A120]|nr:unnamed protein product [Amoebophrya sp. A120]|eukprot:GSA120T00001841001.1
MLNQKYPEVLDWGKYLETTSTCRRFTAYTWPKGEGHPQPKKKTKLIDEPVYPFIGPKYKLPCALPEGEDQMSMLIKSHCSRDGVPSVPRDSRFTKQGVIKGLMQKVSAADKLGPGEYDVMKEDERRYGTKGYTFPKAIETPDQVRARSVLSQIPPPGSYDVRGIFDYSDDEDDMSTLSSKPSHATAQDKD